MKIRVSVTGKDAWSNNVQFHGKAIAKLLAKLAVAS